MGAHDAEECDVLRQLRTLGTDQLAGAARCVHELGSSRDSRYRIVDENFGLSRSGFIRSEAVRR